MEVRRVRRHATRVAVVSLAGALGAASGLFSVGAPAIAAAAPLSQTAGSGGIGPYSGLAPAFTANFSGTSLDTATWQTCYPWFPDPASGCTNFGNAQEEEWYLASQDQVSGGALQMVADKTPTVGTTQTGARKIWRYRSGMVTTYSSFSFTYGYVRVVAKLPGGTGTWPALWLLPESQAWPPEIDIMENWGTPSTVSSTLHFTTSLGASATMRTVTVPENLTTTWNTYSVLWQPGSLTFFVDTTLVHTITGSEVPSVPMYFLANLAIDGPAKSGAAFDVQSVQIYDATSQPVTSTQTPATSPPASPSGAPAPNPPSTPVGGQAPGTSPPAQPSGGQTAGAGAPAPATGVSPRPATPPRRQRGAPPRPVSRLLAVRSHRQPLADAGARASRHLRARSHMQARALRRRQREQRSAGHPADLLSQLRGPRARAPGSTSPPPHRKRGTLVSTDFEQPTVRGLLSPRRT